MIFHIIKKDLKRKRVTNFIVFLFILLATTFMASSTNNLSTIMGAVDYFLEVTKTPDFLVVALSDTKNNEVEDYLKTSRYVSEYEVMDMYAITDNEIEILKCAANPDNHKYERNRTTAIGALTKDFLKVFDENNELFELADGEIAIPIMQANQNSLSTGDILKISCGEKEMEFTVKVIMKDAVFGAETMGFRRLLITQADYQCLVGEASTMHTLLYAINCKDPAAFKIDFNKKAFQVATTIERSMQDMLYVFEMLIAGIFMIVSICLLIISFLILRFTIVFTIQEDYCEVGIMKAIGIRNNCIKGIYLLKYLAIALIGAFLGLLLSLPMGELLIQKAISNMVAKSVESNLGLNILCAVAIVLMVMLFCYLSTGKVKKFSAIEAIRNGNQGERYKAKTVFRLHTKRRMIPAFYMAVNDVAGNVKRFIILCIIFCVGTLEILLPLTVMHTLKNDGIITSFGLQVADAFIDPGNMEEYMKEDGHDNLLKAMQEIEEDLLQAGMDAQVWVETGYTVPCYSEDPEQTVQYGTFQVLGNKEDDYEVLEGRMPMFTNEIMITELTAQELNVNIGDSIYFKYPEQVKEYMITGTFQSMMNMGKGFRISHEAAMDSRYISNIMAIQVKVDSKDKNKAISEQIQEVFPDYKVYSANAYANNLIGGILEQLDSIKILLVSVVVTINVLITVLLMKLLFYKERGEIAMLKSIGFSNHTLKTWQSLRILLVLVFSIILGAILCKCLAPLVAGPIFAMMGGTGIKLVIKPLEAYLIIPILLIITTGAACWLCAGDVKKVDLKEINTLE